MPVFKAKMATVFYDTRTSDEGDDCEIKIDGSKIVVSYEDDDDEGDENGLVEYYGDDMGNGHFELKCPRLQGHATLHQTEGSKFLDGYWHEGNERGFWRIKLP